MTAAASRMLGDDRAFEETIMADAADIPDPLMPGAIAFIGFGEAATAILKGWRQALPAICPRVYDIKTDSPVSAVRAAKLEDYRQWAVEACDTSAIATAGTRIVFSLVTADQAHAAALAAARDLPAGTLFLDGNSCSPGAKRQSAKAIEAAGGRYVDLAIMAPVHPALHKTPLLVSGPHAETALGALARLGMVAEAVEGGIGAASSIKMVRSIMIKGLEALVAECMLSARLAGVETPVIASLDKTFPGFDWTGRSAYMLERVMTHGIRRAAEMREVAATVTELGLDAGMVRATVDWQQAIGDLRLDASTVEPSLEARADAILSAFAAESANEKPREAVL
jgi:3-hydroxyisobutyrate dehydrogenase-like beta-hydroxyacid dehydrogenase